MIKSLPALVLGCAFALFGCGELAQLRDAIECACERRQECGFSTFECGELADAAVELAQDQDAACIEAFTNFGNCQAQAACDDIAACEFRLVIDACDFSPP